MEEKKAKQEEMDNANSMTKTPTNSSGGGDLLSDLANKLAMRRKGISGNQNQGVAAGGNQGLLQIYAFVCHKIAFFMRITLSESFQMKYYIQFRKMNIAPLVNKPYVNEVTLNEQNLH